MSDAFTPEAIITAGLVEIIQEIADVPIEGILPETDLTDGLGIDSLTLVEVVVAAEERFAVKIPDHRVKDLKTVGNIVDHILGIA
ncbi:acyl carrier protein [Streptomyces sp. NBC_01190]|jgi:acyl carrier protein|uniref:acyl carrier protein n=1 Tax=Streptomyces sp. NBC_01190 TaxID=2903767 RepID=UPI00386E6131|nr:acyl carrier protein [Streptomyces sp. NBC_01190]